MLLFAGDSDGDIVAATLCPALVKYLQATAAEVEALDLGPAKAARGGRTEVNWGHKIARAAPQQ